MSNSESTENFGLGTSTLSHFPRHRFSSMSKPKLKNQNFAVSQYEETAKFGKIGFDSMTSKNRYL